jgi:5-methylcytosine-specific restriction protein A
VGWDKQGTAAERGYGWQWRNTARRILARDGGLCQLCKAAGRMTFAAEVDHIVNKARGGTDDDDNLQAICRPCHEAKTADERGRPLRDAIGLDGWPVGR